MPAQGIGGANVFAAGQATAPGAGATVVTGATALSPGRWLLRVKSGQFGTTDTNIANGILAIGGVNVAILPTAPGYGESNVEVQVSEGAGNGVVTCKLSLSAGGAGSIYGFIVNATQVA